MKNLHAEPAQKGKLNEISTAWEMVHDSSQFVRRYMLAIRKYLNSLIRNHHDAEDVLHDFLLRVIKGGFLRVKQKGGRFRDYLKTAVRNAALNHLQRKAKPPKGTPGFPRVVAENPPSLAADHDWVSHWRTSLLERAWRVLKRHQSQTPGNLSYTVLHFAVHRPNVPSEESAVQVSEATGHPLRPEAFRKQLSRSRRLFAQILVREVAQTLDHATREQVEGELLELGLMRHVRGYLSDDWFRGLEER